jgi:hypothetical protein
MGPPIFFCPIMQIVGIVEVKCRFCIDRKSARKNKTGVSARQAGSNNLPNDVARTLQ